MWQLTDFMAQNKIMLAGIFRAGLLAVIAVVAFQYTPEIIIGFLMFYVAIIDTRISVVDRKTEVMRDGWGN